MGATTDQNLIAEQTTVVHHNFFSDLVMLILLSGKKGLVMAISCFDNKLHYH